MYSPGIMSVIVPTSLSDALQALADAPDATVLAGGTDLMVELNGGQRQVALVVAVGRVAELCTWHHDPMAGVLHIGAGITYAEIATGPIAAWVPALAQAARTVGSPQIRHAATIGGNVGTCSPAGDGLPVLSALDATVHLASATGVRDVLFGDYMVGPKRTVRLPGELITGVTVPVLDGWQGYSKVGVRNAMVIATASVALVTDTETRSVRLALGSVGPVVLRCPAAEVLASTQVDFEAGRVSDEVVLQFVALARDAARPIDDHRSTAAYRRHAVGVLAGRLLRRAFPNE
jgi:CO/xanthine dehydrogenase FAD-binding subunit